MMTIIENLAQIKGGTGSSNNNGSSNNGGSGSGGGYNVGDMDSGS
ncbi:MAG: hypothetical protein AAFQ98_11395 [Bacteroidota bacterium]